MTSKNEQPVDCSEVDALCRELDAADSIGKAHTVAIKAIRNWQAAISPEREQMDDGALLKSFCKLLHRFDGCGEMPEDAYESDAEDFVAIAREHFAYPPKRESGWLPIETAPKDSEHGIIARKGFFVFWTDWDDEDEAWFTQNLFYESSLHAKKYDGGGKWEPTHWMPLNQIESDK